MCAVQYVQWFMNPLVLKFAAYTFKKTKLSAVKVLFPVEDDQWCCCTSR